MGLMTLAELRTELDETIGDRNLDSARLDLFLNWAYLDITGALELEELEASSDINTVASQTYIAKPDAVSKVLLVKDNDNSALLQYVDKTEYFRLNPTTEGTPIKWTELGEQIFLHPTPDSIISEKVVYKQTVTALSADGDTTIIDATYDLAIHMLAVSYCYMDVGEDQRAALWFNRAVSYIRSRIDSEDIFIREPGLGLSMAVPQARMITALEGAISGNLDTQ